MKIILGVLVFVASSLGIAGTTKTATVVQEKDAFKVIHVSDLAGWMDAKKNSVYIFDANTDKTREANGVIPGAKLLATSSQFDAGKILPPDKDAKIVFYCANTQCMASHDAAKVAVKAGYKDVSVMADGIQGWKKAGKPTEKFKKS